MILVFSDLGSGSWFQGYFVLIYLHVSPSKCSICVTYIKSKKCFKNKFIHHQNTKLQNFIILNVSLSSYAPNNDVLVNDGPHIQWWS